jgi:type VI secretion system secreted protein VgrG
MKNLEVTVASSDALDIRHFAVQEQMSAIFTVSLTVECTNANIDFDAVVGKDATFTLHTPQGPRSWRGICRDFHQAQVEETGLSTYQITIVPTLWLLTQRRNYRMFQQLSEIEIVQQLLSEWGIEPEMKINAAAYKKRKYKVQYGESDFDFIARLLEEVGVSFYFAQQESETKLVLNDAPQTNEPRPEPLPFVDSANARGDRLHVTNVQVHQRVRPGKYTVRDHDYRLPPSYQLKAEASGGQGIEARLERFHYNPGAFLFRSDRGEPSPSADDRGKTRSDERAGAVQAERRLAAKRSSGKRATFDSNALDLAPGAVLTIANHPRSDLGEGQKHLVLEVGLHGEDDGEWALHAEIVSAAQPYHPPVKTPKPRTQGVESATVVGPAGEEIHTDEFGRVRVHFHWDRESRMDDSSSCWIHVSQPWGGSGYGGSNLPRIGQEVLIDFLGGDPDRPVIVGRMYTNLQKTPYKLPENKTQSGWKSNSTGGGGGYNEIMFEDAQGREVVRMQAERDRETLVKNNSSTTIRANRTMSVGATNTENITQAESITVGGMRTVTVRDDMEHTVSYHSTTSCLEGNNTFNTHLEFCSNANVNRFSNRTRFEAFCGSSGILMTTDCIILQSPKILLNPGASVFVSVRNGGALPPSQAERDAAEHQRMMQQRRALERMIMRQTMPFGTGVFF